ncbi:hypothetical protein GCM10010326_55360 [Streptomyces xanthochromogenes]|uniref:HEAT repeat domain-containing protein n=1 Tax=Streptomyces xanthochromogenes TaxID=67384 RepID=A0ABQ3AHP3_9ACTN|nr:hypothetical protein GCM10010326_55360 [Streptomyces xanthochromogenes]
MLSHTALLSQRRLIETSRRQPAGVDESTEQGLRDALAEAESPAWSVRAAAGRRLAAAPRIEGVAGVLHRLLLDAQDTGATSDTAAALLARGDPAGLRAVLAALAVASDQGTADQLAAELDRDPRWATGQDGDDLIARLRILAASGDPDVHNEALSRLACLR